MINNRRDRPMDWQPLIYTGSALVLLAIGGAAGYFAAHGRGTARPEHARAAESRHELRTEPVDFGAPSHARTTTTRTEASKSRLLLAAPPTIDGVTLRDYLTHHATKPCPHREPDDPRRPLHSGTWPCVTEDTYAGALGSDLVAPYFEDLDATGLAELKGHFLSALVTVTHVGLYLDVAERLEASHAHLGITEPVFDAVTGVLVQSIGNYATTDVMNLVLPQMTPLVRELRGRLVTA